MHPWEKSNKGQYKRGQTRQQHESSQHCQKVFRRSMQPNSERKLPPRPKQNWVVGYRREKTNRRAVGGFSMVEQHTHNWDSCLSRKNFAHEVNSLVGQGSNLEPRRHFRRWLVKWCDFSRRELALLTSFLKVHIKCIGGKHWSMWEGRYFFIAIFVAFYGLKKILERQSLSKNPHTGLFNYVLKQYQKAAN